MSVIINSASAATLGIGSAIASGTSGSVLYIDSTGKLAQDNSYFFWDDTNHRLGLGINSSITAKIHAKTTAITERSSIFQGSSNTVTTASPETVTGLKLWLKADALSLSDGDTVTSWTDSSGNGYAFTNSAGTPQYKTNVILGKPAVYYGGGTTSQNGSVLGGGNFAGTEATMFVVFVPVTTSSTDSYGVISTGTTGDAYWRYGPTGQGLMDEFSNTRYALASSMPTSGSHIVTISSGTGANTYQMWLDGASQGTRTPTWGLSTTMVIGRSTNSTFLIGYVAEVIVYNVALSATNRQNVENYLANKYGINNGTFLPQSANLTEWRYYNDSVSSYVDSVGNSTFSQVTASTGIFTNLTAASVVLTPSSISQTPLTIRQFSGSQTANLLSFQNLAGTTTYTNFDSAGNFNLGSASNGKTMVMRVVTNTNTGLVIATDNFPYGNASGNGFAVSPTHDNGQALMSFNNGNGSAIAFYNNDFGTNYCQINASSSGMTLTTNPASSAITLVAGAATASPGIFRGTTSQSAVLMQLQGMSSVQNREQVDIDTAWATSTDATRKARGLFRVWDTVAREAMRIEASGSAAMIGFLGATAAARTSAYTPTNVTTDRSYDANSTSLDEIADVLGTLIADLQGFGLLG